MSMHAVAGVPAVMPVSPSRPDAGSPAAVSPEPMTGHKSGKSGKKPGAHKRDSYHRSPGRKIVDGVLGTAKVAGQVVTGAVGTAVGFVSGAVIGTVGSPIVGVGSVLTDDPLLRGMSTGEKALLAIGSVVGAPVVGVVGALQFGYIGARTGADLVEEAADPANFDLGRRVDEHVKQAERPVDWAIGKILR